MHELRIAADLAEMVERYASEAGWKAVERVNVTFGQFIQVVPDLLESAFRVAARGSVPADAELVIEIVPAEMRCMHCGAPYMPAGDLHACQSCGSEEIELIHGKELFIKSIEGG